MITCGIDASSSCTGICIFDDLKLIYYEKLKPNKKTYGFREKSCEMIELIIPIIQEYKPEHIYMEDVPTFVRTGGRGGNILSPMIALGALQGMTYLELVHKLNYDVEFLDLSAWRKGLGFLNGSATDRNRDHQKDKAVRFVNEKFGLNLYYTLGKKSVKDDDDIAESIAICWSKLNGYYDKAIKEREEKERLATIKKNKKKMCPK